MQLRDRVRSASGGKPAGSGEVVTRLWAACHAAIDADEGGSLLIPGRISHIESTVGTTI